MAIMECKLGATFTKRFPNGTVELKVSDDDREWLSHSKIWISGWDQPLLITKGATGDGEGLMEYMSLARAIMSRHGFEVPKGTYVWRIDGDDRMNVEHDNLIIPEMLVPEFQKDTEYYLTLAGYLKGVKEAASRLASAGEGNIVTCFEEGTRKSCNVVLDPEDANFFSGTKVKFTRHGHPLFFCEDMKYRTATQELIRRDRLGVKFGSLAAISRHVGKSKFDIRKGNIAVFHTERKSGR